MSDYPPVPHKQAVSIARTSFILGMFVGIVVWRMIRLAIQWSTE